MKPVAVNLACCVFIVIAGDSLLSRTCAGEGDWLKVAVVNATTNVDLRPRVSLLLSNSSSGQLLLTGVSEELQRFGSIGDVRRDDRWVLVSHAQQTLNDVPVRGPVSSFTIMPEESCRLIVNGPALTVRWRVRLLYRQAGTDPEEAVVAFGPD